MFQHYNATLDNAFGGEVGINIQKQIWKGLSLGLDAGYRYLKINEYVCGWNDGGAPGVTGWILEQNRDMGGFKVSVFLEYRF